jgi:hypothetical protein
MMIVFACGFLHIGLDVEGYRGFRDQVREIDVEGVTNGPVEQRTLRNPWQDQFRNGRFR